MESKVAAIANNETSVVSKSRRVGKILATGTASVFNTPEMKIKTQRN